MKKWILVFCVVLVGIWFGIRFLSGEDDWICQNGAWVKHGMPRAPAPTTPCSAGTYSR
jgi:hypothetical protein